MAFTSIKQTTVQQKEKRRILAGVRRQKLREETQRQIDKSIAYNIWEYENRHLRRVVALVC